MACRRSTFADERFSTFVEVVASTGLRGRVDARGHRRHAPPGLTRTTGQPADAPSRDRRAGACGASAWTFARDCAARRGAARGVNHEKERRQAGRWFASSPDPCQSDGRGHRRGLDGPPMPKPFERRDTCICPNRPRVPAARRACTCGAGRRAVEGIAARHEKCRARPARATRSNFNRTPSEFGRPGRIQSPSAGATSARPPCRNAGSPDRAKRTTKRREHPE